MKDQRAVEGEVERKALGLAGEATSILHWHTDVVDVVADTAAAAEEDTEMEEEKQMHQHNQSGLMCQHILALALVREKAQPVDIHHTALRHRTLALAAAAAAVLVLRIHYSCSSRHTGLRQRSLESPAAAAGHNTALLLQVVEQSTAAAAKWTGTNTYSSQPS